MYIILRAKIWICPGTKVKKPHENWYQLFMYMTTNNQTHDQFISWALTAQSPCVHGLAALQPLPDWWTCYCHRCAKPRCYLYTLNRSSANAALQSFPAVAFIGLVIFVAAAAVAADGGCRDGHPWPRELKGALRRPWLWLWAALLLRTPEATHQHNRLAHGSHAGRSSVVQPVLLNMNMTWSNKFPIQTG